MQEPYTVTVTTFCPAYHTQVKLTLLTTSPPTSQIVKGKPIDCNHRETCSKKESPYCYLKSIQIETRRR